LAGWGSANYVSVPILISGSAAVLNYVSVPILISW